MLRLSTRPLISWKSSQFLASVAVYTMSSRPVSSNNPVVAQPPAKAGHVHDRPQLDFGSDNQLSDKKILRKQINRLLSLLPDREVESQSVKATELLLSLPEYKNAKTISIFMSMPSGEINTGRLLKHALASGKQVFIPYIYKVANPTVQDLPASIIDMLQLSSDEDQATLKPDKWGIPSISRDSVGNRLNSFGGKGISDGLPPKQDAPGLDVIVMPSMAFDMEMNRLGHGKGFYDNFLTRYCSGRDGQGERRKKPFLVGFALADQLIPSPYRLPTECWDWKVDAVVVGSATSDARLILPDP